MNRMPDYDTIIGEADTRLYECCVLYPHPIPQKEEKELLESVEEIFEEAKARQVAKDLWGRRGLAYPIKGYTEGSFAVYHYEMDPSAVKETNMSLQIAQGILRHLLIKPPKGFQITKFSESYEKWLKERESEEDRKIAGKEEELKKKVAEKAKRQVKKAEEEKKIKIQETADKPVAEDKLAEELEKLISSDELDF